MSDAITTPLITQAEFARRHGISRQAVNDYVTRGIIALHGGLIDEAEALQSIADKRDPARKSKLISGEQPLSDPPAPTPPAPDNKGEADLPTTDESLSFHAAKTRRETAEASKSELQLAMLRSELINRAGAERALETAIRQIRDAVMSVPDRLALPRAHQIIVRDAIAAALADAAKSMTVIA